MNNRIDTKFEHSSVTRAPDITILHSKIRCVYENTRIAPMMLTPSPEKATVRARPDKPDKTVWKLLKSAIWVNIQGKLKGDPLAPRATFESTQKSALMLNRLGGRRHGWSKGSAQSRNSSQTPEKPASWHSTKNDGYGLIKELLPKSRTNNQQIATEHLLLTVEPPKVPPNSKLWPRTGPKSQP